MENKFEQQLGSNVETLNEPWFADRYWHVPVRWGDGNVTISNFPETGIPVFDKDHPVYVEYVVGNKKKRSEKPRFIIDAETAIRFLKEHSKDYKTYDELNWNDCVDKFLDNKKNGKNN